MLIVDPVFQCPYFVENVVHIVELDNWIVNCVYLHLCSFLSHML